MKNLTQFINESGGISDDQIWFQCGVHMLNTMESGWNNKIVKRYKISKSNPKPGIIRYMKDNYPALPKDSEEFIHRKDWDLDSLVGETEGQLMHKDYYKMANHILQTRKRQNDILAVFQCSSKKPYSSNHIYNDNYFKVYKSFIDFACISNPGVVPIEYSQYYPYRYDEWSRSNEEKLHKLINLTHKCNVVYTCRLIRFIRESGYKHVIVLMGNPNIQQYIDEMMKHNIANCNDWMSIVTTDAFRNAVIKHRPKLKDLKGLAYPRIPNFPETRKRFERLLRAQLEQDELEEFNKVVKARDEHLKKNKRTNESLLFESQKEPEYKMLKTINYDEFLKKFKNTIKDNMKDSSVDKGSNNLYYKSYYWTALDLLLLAMDGNLLEDIDGTYWEFMNKLVADKDFIHMGGFVFCYKPLMEHDNVSQETIEKEANDLKLIWKKPEYKLNSSIFN